MLKAYLQKSSFLVLWVNNIDWKNLQQAYTVPDGREEISRIKRVRISGQGL